MHLSEAWEPPQFQEKRSRSEKAGCSRSSSETRTMRRPQFSQQLPERFPELMGTHMKDLHLPLHSWSFFFKNWGGPARAPESQSLKRVREESESQVVDSLRALLRLWESKIAPKRPFLAQLATFGPSPRLLKRRLDFHENFPGASRFGHCSATPNPYNPICSAVSCWLLSLEERETQHASYLYRSVPPIC